MVLAVQAASLLAGCMGHPPQDPPAAVDDGAARAALSRLLEERLGPAGAALHRLLGGEALLNADSVRPGNLDTLLGRVLPAGLPRLEVPAPPRDGALAAALDAYGAEMGVPVPAPPELALLIRPLGLDGDGEYALAQLILAYTQAVHLERQATAALRSGAGPADLGATLQAADLLARTAELVRGPLARARLDAAPANPGSWEVLRGVVLRGAPAPALPPFPAGLRLDDALRSLATAIGQPGLQIPAAGLPTSLDHAVALIVQAKADGAGRDGAWAALRMLQAAQEAQPTLEAWAALLRMPAAPRLDAGAALERAVSPAPDAAAVVAALRGNAADGPAPIPSLLALLQEQGLSAADAAAAQAALPPAAADALALMVDAHDGLRRAREEAFAGLTQRQSAAIAVSLGVLPLLGKPAWNATEAQVVRAWAEGMAGLDASHLDRLQRAQEKALAQVGQAAQLLQGLRAPQDASGGSATPTLSPSSVPTSTPTSGPLSNLPIPDPPATGGVCAGDGVPSFPSDCGNNVLLFLSGSIRILVTGFGSSRVDDRYGSPDILLDLGGSDIYTVPVGLGIGLLQPLSGTANYTGVPTLSATLPPGSAQERAMLLLEPYIFWGGSVAGNLSNFTLSGAGIGLAIDAGGSDTYGAPQQPAGEGVGVGPGALGALVDLQGDDLYARTGLGVGHGFGAFGGVGVLADLGGADRYRAPEGMAQGASDVAFLAATYATDAGGCPSSAWTGAVNTTLVARGFDEGVDGILCPHLHNLTALPGGIGLLLDEGPGRDEYTALAGQGFSTGRSAGLLIDTEGDGTYGTVSVSGSFQGGRGGAPVFLGAGGLRAGDNTGFGALVDLGGDDAYSNPQLPANHIVFARADEPKERHDDAVWIDPDNGLGIGIDANSLQGLADALGGGPGASAVQLLLETVARAATPPDPDQPAEALKDSLFDDRLLCNILLNGAEQPGACTAANRGDLYACDPSRRFTCLSLLSLTGIGGTLHDHPALVAIDLGGNDAYNTTVAGTYVIPTGVAPRRDDRASRNTTAINGVALELGGSDRYATPHLSGTLGAAGAIGKRAAAGGTQDPLRDAQAAAVLLDLDGNDLYESAGAATGGGQGVANRDEGLVGLLADFNGTDTYRAGAFSQGSVSCQTMCHSLGALADLAGDDTYVFHRQGAALQDANGTGGQGVFLDLRGRDRYLSSLPVQDAGLSPDRPNDAFVSQGWSDGGFSPLVPAPFARGLASQGMGVFLDNGTDADLYQAPAASDGRPLDGLLSPLKNNAVLRGDARWVGNGTGVSRFADNPQGAFEDRDGDGAPGWTEILAGTDPNDGNDSPGSAATCADLAEDPSPACLGQDPLGCSTGQPVPEASDPLRCIGGDGPVANATVPLRAVAGPSPVQLAQGLFVGGHASTTYAGLMPPFFVDLGGHDTYTAPNTGGAATRWDARTPDSTEDEAALNPGVTLLLDAAGDDAYLPAHAPCGPAILFVGTLGTGEGQCGSRTVCGGTLPPSSASGPRQSFGPCPTLGAAVGAIAILADGGGSNRFESHLRINGTVDTFGEPQFDLRGLSQGAGAAGGVGVLATWDAVNTFLSTVEASLERTGSAHAGIPAIGVAGNAQGAGIDGGFGVLAAFGRGSDTYTSRTLAQVASTTDGDVEAAPTLACAQGAACGGGSLSAVVGFNGATLPSWTPDEAGILYDEDGDNRYAASGAFAQGGVRGGDAATLDGSGSGLGVLWSGPGTDRYAAGAFSQAAAQRASGNAAALVDTGGSETYTILPPVAGGCDGAQGSAAVGNAALLLDLGGDDRYDASECSSAHGPNSLVDLGGEDVYLVDGDRHGTNQRGRSHESSRSPLPSATDASVTVDDPGQTVSGNVTFTARVEVTGNAKGGVQVDRVAFGLAGDGQEHTLLGDGTPNADRSAFTLTLDTRALASDGTPTFQDGGYSVKATAFLVPASRQGGADPRPRADLYYADSPSRTFSIDNLPVFQSSPTLVLGNPDLPGISPPLGQSASVTLDVSRDVQSTHYKVFATKDGTAIPQLMRSGTASTGPSTIALAPAGGWPQCGGANCTDGLYRLRVFLQDASRTGTLDGTWASVVPPEDSDGLLIDSTRPTSTVAQGRYAGNGPNHRDPTSYFITVASSDANPGTSVALVRVQKSGNAFTSPQEVPGQLLTDIAHGQTVHLVTVAADRQGNQESACVDDADRLPAARHCYQAKLAVPANVANVTFDFKAPAIAFPLLTPLYAKPGGPVAFNATITDDGTGIALQSVTLPEGLGALNLTTGAKSNAAAAWPTQGLQSWQGREGPYTATLVAQDKAGNAVQAKLIGYLDDLAPRVNVSRIVYTDPFGANPAAMGRPNMTAQISVRLQDIPGIAFDSIAGLWADASPLGGNRATACPRGDLGVWVCEIKIPATAANADYPIRLNATDKAGNWNATTALVQVHGDPLAIAQQATVVATDHGSFTVHWRTDRLATTALRYGKTTSLQHRVENATLALNHTATVRGLEPATAYFFRGESTTPAGVTNLTPPGTLPGTVVTGHGFTLALEGFAAGQPRAGAFTATVRATDLAGLGPVDVRLKLQEVQGGRPAGSGAEKDHATFLGARGLRVDTVGVPDGTYRLLVEGQRGNDRVNASSASFRIDNTGPILSPTAPLDGGVVAASRPTLSLQVVDPSGGALPDLATLGLAIDGDPVPPSDANGTPVPDHPQQMLLRLRPPDTLGEGRHAATVSLRDAAGNRGEVHWNFTVDTRAPALDGAPALFGDGRTAARPGSLVALRLNLTDAHGVGSVLVDLSAFNGDLHPMYAKGGAWEATIPLPAPLADGTVLLPITAVDLLNNTGLAGTVEIPVDGTPPTLELAAAGVNRTGLVLQARLGEPATLSVLEGGRLLAPGGPRAAAHSIPLAGLRPGREHRLTVQATDGAGNVANGTLVVRTLDDTRPPSGVGPLRAASEEEGVVELQWSPAADDSGVQGYAVARSGDGVPSLRVTVPANATSFRDASAPPGRLASYRVHAVDVADLEGSAATASVAVLALPHLSGAAITPERGTTDTPFTVRVTYRHPTGQPADGLTLLVGGAPYILQRADATDCAAGCRYEATVHLPATSLADPAAFTLRAATEGRTAELPIERGPVVLLGRIGNEGGVQEGDHSAPMPLAALQALLVVALAALARRRR